MNIPHDYDERVYAGWLGKCIGVKFGAPLENWTYEDIRDNLGELTTYLRDDAGKIFKPDDDTAVPMILIRALETLPAGQALTAQHVADALLNGIGDGHGTFWWGGYGVSTEHTAYMNLAAGIPAPQSGSIAQNGAALAEQIGGQIFSDIWGLVAPDDPAPAANMAAIASSVTHDGEGINGGRFIAALVSAAFTERDPRKLIATALQQIPANSEYARVVNAMCDFHAQNPSDWRAAFAHLKANFGYDRYLGIVHIIPNAGVVIIGLLYGTGDFSRAIQITNMCGWDTDCNVGNVGAVMGVAVGLDGIDESWRAPMNDLLIAAGVVGTRNILTIPQCADLFCALGRRLSGSESDKPPRYHFKYSGSTNNFEAKGKLARPIHQQQAVVDGKPVLQTAVRKLNKKGEVRVFTRTYYRPKELSGNYYGACFTPLIFPGQKLLMRIYLPPDAPDTLTAALYVYDDNHGVSHQPEAVSLKPGQWTGLAYKVPPLTDACIAEAGVVVRNLGEVWETGSFSIENLDWNQHREDFTITFAKERAESGGISQWTRARGYWRLEDGAYHGSGVGLCETYTGDIDWENYRIAAEIIPLIGDHHLILARVQGASGSYAFGLAPDGKIALYKKDKQPQMVASAPFAWRQGEKYTLTLTANGDTLTGRMNDIEISWRDPDAAYMRGQIGLATWHGGHMAVHSVSVRSADA